MTLGQFVKAYREQHDLSQRQLAAQSGLSNSYISLLEKGRNPRTGEPITPNIDNLGRLAKAMGMTLHQLMQSVDDLEIDMEPISERVWEITRMLRTASDEQLEDIALYIKFRLAQPER